jgi:RecA/RadA recombinase
MATLALVGAAQESHSHVDPHEGARPKTLARAPLFQHFQPGQLLELSGAQPGKLSTAARLVAHAQNEGEPVAWVAFRDDASFYPPDFVALGIDLAALVVVRLPQTKGNAATHTLVRASELLLRSGAFGLVIVDFGKKPVPRGELAWQARLSGLVRMHEARLVLLTGSAREQPSLGPLIALRVEPESTREGSRVVLRQQVLKSKLGASAALLSPDVRSMPVGAT